VLVGIGADPGFTPNPHQQALVVGPFGNTYEEDAVSPEEDMRGLQDKDVYNQGNIKWIKSHEQHNIHSSLIILIYFMHLSDLP
jgi:hypothetical protein